jgi:hypothetical protein
MNHDFSIQKGIPIPPRENGRGHLSQLTLAMKQMDVGDCIDVPFRGINLYAKAKVAGIHFTVRTIRPADGSPKFWRVWRTS